MRLWMHPSVETVSGQSESGIKQVVRKYSEHLPAFGVTVTADAPTIVGVHAGMTYFPDGDLARVAFCHGLYWTEGYEAPSWQHRANRTVIHSLKAADLVTVPSEWVAQTLRRDMHLDPVVIPHGVDVQEWDSTQPGRFILWNKNRNSDACDPYPVHKLAWARTDLQFVTTFASPQVSDPQKNLTICGPQPHDRMRELVENCSVYLSTTKETFGIGILEAMAAGRPVLGFREGNISRLVEHGVNGYLAQPGHTEDLLAGLDYCLVHADTLGKNGREMAKTWTWQDACRQLADALARAVEIHRQPHRVTVVIPCYNKASTVERAVRSALAQTLQPDEIVIVDNNSTDGSLSAVTRLAQDNPDITVLTCAAQGVAHARNTGIAQARTRYICCLDADDEIAPTFLATCVDALKDDRSLGLAYTKLTAIQNEHETLSQWPGDYNFDEFARRKNQVPTCCVFRRDVALRLGGFRQRYAPDGAGAEDAEFWLRMGAAGYPGKLASQEGLFRYHIGGAVGGNPNYHEVDWLAWQPWVKDKRHPYASCATPLNEMAHPVRAYDLPVLSVVIPLSPSHTGEIVDALDSLEAQAVRNWEAIVVCDGFSVPPNLHNTYPYVRWIEATARGAGAARNLGASQAHSDYLLFLDADDWLQPNALERLLEIERTYPGQIIYSDYYGHAQIADPKPFEQSGRLLDYNPKTQRAVVYHKAFEYNCAEAQRQPALDERGNYYVWNLVTSLLPKQHHDSIGGFDEAMPSWEDWDYWIRMAKAGYCFVRLDEPLVSYRFATGSRREIGRQKHAELLDYLAEKYRSVETMPCRSCGGAKPKPPPAQVRSLRERVPQMSSTEMVEVTLVDGNKGDHPIMINGNNYGYRSDGDIFLMRHVDAAAYPRRFRINGSPQVQPTSAVTPAAATPPPPDAKPKDKDKDKDKDEVEPAVNWNSDIASAPGSEGITHEISKERAAEVLGKRETRKPKRAAK